MRWPEAVVRNAVVAKELRTRARSRDFKALATVYLGILGALVITFLIQHGGPTPGRSSHDGVQLFQVLAIFQLALILFVSPISVAGAVSSERQRETWDLLLVTRLSSFDIIWGKLLAGLAFNFILVFASLPLLSSVFLFGGVGLGDVFQAYAVFLTTVVLLGIISLFISVLSYRPTVSVIISGAVSLLLGVGISLLVIYLEAGPQESGLAALTNLGSLPPDLPPLTPLAQIDPLVVLLSVLPNGNGGALIGDLGSIHHAFGLPLRLPLLAAFCLLTVAISATLLAASTLFTRLAPRRLTEKLIWIGHAIHRLQPNRSYSTLQDD